MKIYIKDLVACNYCIKGIKEFCKRHNLDFRKLVREGINVEEIKDIDDAMLFNIINYVSKSRGGDNSWEEVGEKVK